MKNYAGKNRSNQQHSYSVAQPGVARERSTISRPSRTNTAIDAGWLYPVYVDEVLPGDTFQLRMEMLGRLATPSFPFMDNLYVDTFFFFVPNRLVWEHWEEFQGQKVNPGDTVTYTVPQIEIAGGSTAGLNKLADYMGIPTIATTKEVNALPFRCYNLIWNEYFRDQNLQDSVTTDIGDANSLEANHVLLKRGKRKDYITGCLPFPQKGDDVILSLGTSADVSIFSDTTTDEIPTFLPGGGASRNLSGGTGTVTTVWDSNPSANGAALWDDPKLAGTADLTTAIGPTVNSLRQSIAVQQILELDARGGTRYPEILKARFGVTSPDFRLQRPEYLGGGSQNINVTPVPATTTVIGGSLVGELAGYGTVGGSGGGFTHSFVEHGIILGLVSIRADYTYFEGLPRMWSRTERFDYYEPALCHLGEQEVLNQEVYVTNNDVTDATVFGYQERFAEYKYGNSMVTSIMRPNAPGTLEAWHLAEEFGSLPVLGDTFIQEDPPVDRVISVPSEPHVKLDCFFTNNTARVMPVFNTPGLRRL